MVDLDGVEVKRPRVFVEVLRNRQNLMELGRSSVDDIECRYICTMKTKMVW